MFLRLWKKRKRGYQIDQYDQGITAAPTTELSWVLLSSCTWTNDLDGLWTKTDPDIPAEGNFDQDIGENSVLDLDTEPLRYEDVLQQYLEKDPTLSAGDIPSIADLNVDSATDMEVNPKTKEQIISELVPKIQMQGMTPARATIAAQEMYAKAESRYGSNADVVLEMLQPGQDPRKYMEGFQNAYIAGKLGDMAALENSGTVAYLTEEQGIAAYTLGEVDADKGTGEMRKGSMLGNVPRFEDLWKGQHLDGREMFQKAGVQRQSFRPISQKRFHDLTIEVRKKGAIIMRGTPEVERHLKAVDATASTLGDILLFKKDVCISEVLEETYHFMQNLRGENADKREPLRTILNEISAKRYILDNAKKYNVPRDETEHIRRQLEGYIKQLNEFMEAGG